MAAKSDSTNAVGVSGQIPTPEVHFPAFDEQRAAAALRAAVVGVPEAVKALEEAKRVDQATLKLEFSI
jgi:hypothetical protein